MQIARRSGLWIRHHNKYYIFSYSNFSKQLLIKKGYKLRAQKILISFLRKIKITFGSLPELVLTKYYNIYAPVITFVTRKIAAKLYFLPWYIRDYHSKTKIVRWFFEMVLSRKETDMSIKLFSEFLDLSKGLGKTIMKVEEWYKLALQNRPYLRYLRRGSRGFRSRLKKYGFK